MSQKIILDTDIGDDIDDALALGLNGWPAFAMELPLFVGLAWVLFIKPEPVV